MIANDTPIPSPGFDDSTHEILFLRDLVRELVRQNCRESTGLFFSGFIGVHAVAMRYLGNLGMMTINDCGGRVVEGSISHEFDHFRLDREPDEYPQPVTVVAPPQAD